MFNNNQFPPVSVQMLVEVEPAVKWLADNGHEATSTALSQCEYTYYVYPDETRMFVSIDTLRTIAEEELIRQLNGSVIFSNVPETSIFTPFTEVADNQVERVESTGSLF